MEPELLEGDGGGSSSPTEGSGVAAGSSVSSTGLTASQRRAEIRRRKLLMNSEERINRIMGFHRPKAGEDGAWLGAAPDGAPQQSREGGRGGRPPQHLSLVQKQTPLSSRWGWIPRARPAARPAFLAQSVESGDGTT